MASRKYSIPELCKLRGSQTSSRLLARFENSPGLAELMRRSQHKAREGRRVSSKKHKEPASLDETEEKVPRGDKPSRRAAAKTDPDPDLEIPEGVETQWKYRGRTGSEADVKEPIPAPAGIRSQKSEGFQRFYKAVVSPTHVRVTAGGRIVPNTRTPASPTAKRGKEKSPEDQAPCGDPDTAPRPGTAEGLTSHTELPPGIPAIFHGIPPGLIPPMAFPYPWMNLGLPYNSRGIPHSFSNPAAAFPDALQETHNLKSSDAACTDKQGEVNVPASQPAFKFRSKWGAQTSHNEQPSAPPSQPTLQANTGNQFMPFMMSPYAGFPHMGGPSMFPPQGMPPPPGFSMPPMPPPGHFSHVQNPSRFSGMSSTSGFPRSPGIHSPMVPPPSSIIPSAITKKQLETLRQTLKWQQDQLLYNRHQINVRDTESKIRALQDNINNFEAVLQGQLAYEKEVYRHRKEEDEDSAPVVHTNSDVSASPQKEEPRTEFPKRFHLSSVRENEVPSSGTGCIDSEPDETFVRGPNQAKCEDDDRTRKSSLPVSAALAKPFEPRTDCTLPGCMHASQPHDLAPEAVSPYPSTTRGRRPCDWKGAEVARGVDLFDDTGIRRAAEEKKRPWQPPSAERRLHESSPAVAPNDHPLDRLGRNGPKSSEPYLVGSLPSHMTAYREHNREYTYPRPLNDDEKHARQLYWGKGSQPAKPGLPKFDGKNFYPPSPARERPTSTSSRQSNRVMHDRAEVDFTIRAARNSIKIEDPRPRLLTEDTGAPESAISSASSSDTVRRQSSFITQYGGTSEDFRKALEDCKNIEDLSDSEWKGKGKVIERGDATEVTRNPRKSTDQFLLAMLKREIASSESHTAVSSTNAQGFLPRFGGGAAASLAPTIANAAGSPMRHSPGKVGDIGASLLAQVGEKRRENCPPTSTPSIAQHFRNVLASPDSSRSTRRGGLSPA